MKQTVLAIIAFFIIISIYTVYLVVGKNTTRSSTQESNTTTLAQSKALIAVEEPVVEQKPVYKAPASTPKSKRIFLQNTIAAITKVKKRLDTQYKVVYALSQKSELTPKEQATIDKLKKSYKVKGIPCLLKRLRTHPVSIVIAQAALETGWGSSRFYREANNIFGIWSFNKSEPRMAAGVKREGVKTIYVKKYKNLEASIEGYYRMMARGRAYKQFRNARLTTDNPFEIIPFLDHYSELRHEYVKRLYFVIKSNKFYELDEPQYQPPGWTNIKPADPKYLVTKKSTPAAKVASKCNKDTNTTILHGDTNSSKVQDITTTPEKEKSVQELSKEISAVIESKEESNNSSTVKSLEQNVSDVIEGKEAPSTTKTVEPSDQNISHVIEDKIPAVKTENNNSQ